MRIALDPGHSRIFPGAIGINPFELRAKDGMLVRCLKIGKLLKQLGHLCKLPGGAAVVMMMWAQMGLAQISIGPYVQKVLTHDATVVWYSDTTTSGVLRYGTTPGQWLESINVASGTLHAVEITGLTPNTKYFYEVSDSTTTLATGPDYYFVTHPPAGSRVPFSFIAAGDLGDGSQNQQDVAARMMAERPKHKFALFLGDIVYENGRRSEYLKNYFPIYKDLIRHFCVWPALGNHDINSRKAAAYFEFFHTPANNPDSIENYYSFDYANAHIVSLDDELMDSGAKLTKQLDWAKQDLAEAKSRGQRWLIAMFHKAPYTTGTHPDNKFTQGTFVPLLEAAGVDLVLSGHSHVAERSFLLNSHQIVNNDSSNYPKNDVAPGAVYVVSGSGGRMGSLEGTHPLMAFQQDSLCGFEIIYVNGDTLKGKYMNKDGAIIDSFTITKKDNLTSVEIAPNTQQPIQYALNYPNPFRPRRSTDALHIVFELSQTLPIETAVYDLWGREVARLSDGELLRPGRHLLQWNGRDANNTPVAAGVYFYRLQAGPQVHTAKILLLP
ncbi:MAG: metallophosphoesterase [bacterium]